MLVKLIKNSYIYLFITFYLLSCGTEESAKEVSKTKIVYDSLYAFIQTRPVIEEPVQDDTTETKSVETVRDSVEVEGDTTTILSEKACDKFIEKLSEFSAKMSKTIKKKKEDPANEEVKKEYKKRKDEYFTWVFRLNERSSESSWQKNNCNLDSDRKAKAQKILKKLEDEMKK